MANLSVGSVVRYSVTPDVAFPGVVIFSVTQSGSMTDSNFTQTLAQSITAACTASAGAYTFDGTNVRAVSGASVPLVINRTVSSVPAGYATYSLSTNIVSGALMPNPTQTNVHGTPTFSVVPYVKGANVSGMEFSGSATTNPFTPTPANIDIYANKGFTCIRLPMRWSRLQHTLFGPLDIVGDGSGDVEKYKALVDYITITKGMYCIIDPHDYGGRTGFTQKLGKTELPVRALEDFLVKLITYLGANNQKIVILLQNEPGGFPTAAYWSRIAQSLTHAIRATGSTQQIQVPGVSSTGAHSWVSSGNGAAMLANYNDPVNNFVYEVHQYLDADNSGTIQPSLCIVGSGTTRMQAFFDWCQTNNAKGFLGEFAGSIPNDPTQCTTELNALLNAVNSSPYMVGWAAWGGGQYWNSNYYFRIENPTIGGPDTAIMDMLESKL